MAGSLYWQFTASVAQIARSVGDPSTTADLLPPGRRAGCASTGRRSMRIEVPPTANHWEAAYLAPKFELARGWLRQLDTTRDDIFYAEGALTDRTYAHWLRDNAISFVALPDAPLDYSSAVEAKLIRSDPPTSTSATPPSTGASTRSATRSRWSRRWAAAAPDASGSAARASPSTSPAPAASSSALNFTPYWSISAAAAACLRQRRLDGRPHRPPRRLPRRRRILPRPGLERDDRRKKTC